MLFQLNNCDILLSGIHFSFGSAESMAPAESFKFSRSGEGREVDCKAMVFDLLVISICSLASGSSMAGWQEIVVWLEDSGCDV